MTETHPRRNLYGRHSGRPLRPHQAEVFERVRASHGFDAAALPQVAADYAETWLEIGIGAGEHLAWQAANNPQALIIGAEYYLNGFARACKHVDDGKLANVRLHHGDARVVMDRLADQSLTRAFILHPCLLYTSPSPRDA